MSERLRKCPFCNSDIFTIRYEGTETVSILCNGCQAQGPKASDKVGAIVLWNRAAKPTAKTDLEIDVHEILEILKEKSVAYGTKDHLSGEVLRDGDIIAVRDNDSQPWSEQLYIFRGRDAMGRFLCEFRGNPGAIWSYKFALLREKQESRFESYREEEWAKGTVKVFVRNNENDLWTSIMTLRGRTGLGSFIVESNSGILSTWKFCKVF
jgi:hypothetical protein